MFARHVFCAFALVAVGCGGDDGSTTEPPLGGSLTVTGDVVDFQTGAAVGTGVTVSSTGITPPPMVAVDGSMFTFTQVPENSLFQVLASATDYRPTYSQVIEALSDNISGVKAPILTNSYVDGLAAAFNVTLTATKGIVMVRLVDANGMPRAGIPANQLVLSGSSTGPFFLDANLNAAVGAQMSTASGYAVWFECQTGITEAGQAASATITVNMPTSPVAAATVTLADALVTDGAPMPMPTNVSFSTQVFPIFSARGCVACHSGGGPGKDLGGLMLDAGVNLTYKECVTEDPTRVVTGTPETSLLLTKPLYESPPNHQTAIFQNTQDPDYQKIYVWIKEGAKNN